MRLLAHLVGDIESPRIPIGNKSTVSFCRTVEYESASANQQGILERLGQLTIATHVQNTLINSKQSLKNRKGFVKAKEKLVFQHFNILLFESCVL
jgi:hypothetical protein